MKALRANHRVTVGETHRDLFERLLIANKIREPRGPLLCSYCNTPINREDASCKCFTAVEES